MSLPQAHFDAMPAAARLAAGGGLSERVQQLRARLTDCDLCPQRCGVDRLAGKTGICRTGTQARISSICDHHGEEPALSGTGGAGTVFVAGCNLRCAYCQNYQISQGAIDAYPAYTAAEIAAEFLRLQRIGCHNLDLVSPTHVVPQLVEGLELAIRDGLRLPVVYNTNGYDSLATLALLDGVVDIYLPDLKYADEENARAYSYAPGYPDIAIAAIREMYRQVGDLVLDDRGIARQGVIVRHLVLPNDVAGTRRLLQRLAEEVSPTVTVSLMAQYYPTHQARAIPALARTITVEEYEDALDAFADAGLVNGWAQDLYHAPDTYRPDFDEEGHPFERGG